MNQAGAQTLTPAENERARALSRMKWIATGLFVLMAIIFGLTFLMPNEPRWLGYVRAFSEAAMVGALADWFAVTALFRHPFGIPIPHTAIVPNNKDRIGESLAGFVERNFLTKDVLEPKLHEIDFAVRLGLWMQKPENAARLSQDAGKLISWLLASIDNDSVRRFLEKNLRSGSGSIQVAPLISSVLGALTAANRHQELIDNAVRIGRQQLYMNQHSIRHRIESQSPWWLPKFVDEEIYQKILGEISRLLDRIGDDPDHPARHSFNEATQELIESLANDPDMVERGESIKEEVLNNPAVQQYLTASWEDIKGYVNDQADLPDSKLRVRLEQAIQKSGQDLQDDKKMQGQIDGWIRAGVLNVLENHRASIGKVISDTVKSWDTDLTTQRVELQVGRDLQFIRINGTLVGGLVGLIIHTLIETLN
ncbi:MAG: DUF445 domain-containing protein [Gammaproteobacteria bacterium]